MSSEWTEKFKEILKSNGIEDPISQVIFKDAGLRGENFGSVAEYVTVTFENVEKSPVHLFVKKTVESGSHGKLLQDWEVFQKESEFLMKYLTRARNFCRSKGKDDLLDIYPKCYYGDDKLIVLENLVLSKGYVLLDKEKQQDFEAARIALVNLGRHHALSNALINVEGGPDAFFKEFPYLKFAPIATKESSADIFKPMFENAVTRNMGVLEKSDVAGKLRATEMLRSFQGNAFNELLEACKGCPGEFLAIIHGDYHNNNMMYLRDSSNGKYLSQKLVDFQEICYGPPSIDISQLLFTAVKAEVRRTKFLELLQSYLDALNATGNALGYPINLTMNQLVESFCAHFQYGFWFGFAFNLGGSQEAMKDLNASDLGNSGNIGEAFDKLMEEWMERNPEKRREIAQSIVEYLAEYEHYKSRKAVQCLWRCENESKIFI